MAKALDANRLKSCRTCTDSMLICPVCWRWLWWVLGYDWPRKGLKHDFHPGSLSENFTSTNLRYAASMIWTCAEPEYRLYWMKLRSNDKQSTTVQHPILLFLSIVLFIPVDTRRCFKLTDWFLYEGNTGKIVSVSQQW